MIPANNDERLSSNAVLRRLRSYISMMAAHQRARQNGKLLMAAADEIERLLRGEFTESEFQGLCHNFSEADAERFCRGCEEYQRKLFGRSFIRGDAHV